SRAWTAADDSAMTAWSRDFLGWLRTSMEGRDEQGEKNNHGSWYDEQLAAVALFVGDTALARQTADGAGPERAALQVKPAGSQPFDGAIAAMPAAARAADRSRLLFPDVP